MTLDDLAAKFRGPAVRTTDGGISVFCPVHEDRKRQSLHLSARPDGGFLLHCFAGCDTGGILAAVGLTIADIMPPKAPDPR